MTYGPTDRRRFTRILAASAASSATGRPVWAACAREAGVAREVLKRHWIALGEAGQAEALGAVGSDAPAAKDPAPPASPNAQPHLGWAARMLGQTSPDMRAEALAELRAERDACTHDTARGQLTKEITKRINDWGTTSGGGGVLTPEEWIEQAVAAAPLLLEAALRCEAVLLDERLWAAVDAARGPE